MTRKWIRQSSEKAVDKIKEVLNGKKKPKPKPKPRKDADGSAKADNSATGRDKRDVSSSSPDDRQSDAAAGAK